MQQEFETQVLDIDIKEIKQKLRKLGAKEEPEVLQRRWVFDITSSTNKSSGNWIRLRQAGKNKPTITYKNKTGRGLGETQELEIEVSDFEIAAMILSKFDVAGKYYQENKRTRFTQENIEFTIDRWPKIPPYLEIEGKSEAQVKKGLKMLGLEGKDVGHLGTVNIYATYGIDLHSFSEIRFEEESERLRENF